MGPSEKRLDSSAFRRNGNECRGLIIPWSKVRVLPGPPISKKSSRYGIEAGGSESLGVCHGGRPRIDRHHRGTVSDEFIQIQNTTAKGWPVYVRLRGQSRRSADTRHRSGDECCTTENGQNRKYSVMKNGPPKKPSFEMLIMMRARKKVIIKTTDGSVLVNKECSRAD
jgi:hypothetical protein